MFDWLDQKWVIGAEWDGVTIVTLTHFLANKNIVVKTIDMPTYSMDDLKLLLDNSGTAYDYTGLFGAAFPTIGRWFKKKWSNPWNNPKAVFCSELIVMWLQSLKLEAVRDVRAADITPELLMKSLSI
jgi:hypothetical protein